MRRIVAVLSVLAALLATAGPAAAARQPLPEDWNGLVGYGLGFSSAAAPPGANNPSCRPKRGQRPVVLVHGTGGNQANFRALSPFLVNHGFCVWTLNYGGAPGETLQAHGRIEDSAAQLKTFVDLVRLRTGAAKVDIVGHSQGGMMPRYYIKFLGGGSAVHRLIGLAPSNHGTTLQGLAGVGALLGLDYEAMNWPAAGQQFPGSPFLAKLGTCPGARSADICPGDPVRHTVLVTRGEQVLTPSYTSAYLQGARNILVNDVCPLEQTEHLGILFSRNAAQLVLRALDPTVRTTVCVPTLPYLGG